MLRARNLSNRKKKVGGEEAEVFSAPLVPVLTSIVHCPSYSAQDPEAVLRILSLRSSITLSHKSYFLHVPQVSKILDIC